MTAQWTDIDAGSALQSYGWRVAVTIPAITSGNSLLPSGVSWDSSANFPFPLNLANGPSALSNCLANGYDFVITPDFTTGADPYTSRLYYERDSFTGGGGSMPGGWLWLNTSTLLSGSASTKIWVWFAKTGASDGSHPANTWDSYHHVVVHNPASPVDSKSANSFTNYGITADSTSPVGAAGAFNGSAYAACPPSSSILVGSSITFATWFKVTTANSPVLLHHDLDYSAYLDTLGGFETAVKGNWNFASFGDTAIGWTTGTWGRLLFTQTSNQCKVYFNGTLIATKTFTVRENPGTNYPLHIGRYTDGGSNGSVAYLTGAQNQISVASIARSDAWAGLDTLAVLNQSAGWWGTAQQGSSTIPPVMPVPLSLNPSLWLKADGLSAGLLSTWSDQSGYGHDATQSNSTLRPIVVSSVHNGLAVVRFGVGGAKSLVSPVNLNQPDTIILVGTMTAASQYFFDGSGSGRQILGDALNGSDVGHMDIYAGGVVGAASADSASWHIWSAVYNGASSKLYKDGTLFASGNAGSANLVGMTIGNRYSLDFHLTGDIGEIGAFPGLSDPDRLSVESYLYNKWFVATTSPTFCLPAILASQQFYGCGV